MTINESEKFSVSLLPVVHLRNPHYKRIRIPGNVLLNADGTMEGTEVSAHDYPRVPIDQVPFIACRSLLEKMLLSPEFADDDEGHVIIGPYRTTEILYPKGDTRHIYRADVLVSPDFPDTVHLLGRDLVKLAAHEAQTHLNDPDSKDWINLALLRPHDLATVDYRDEKYSGIVRVKNDPTRTMLIERRMTNSHTGV